MISQQETRKGIISWKLKLNKISLLYLSGYSYGNKDETIPSPSFFSCIDLSKTCLWSHHSHAQTWKAFHCLHQCSSNMQKIAGFFFQMKSYMECLIWQEREAILHKLKWRVKGEGRGEGRARDPRRFPLRSSPPPLPTYPSSKKNLTPPSRASFKMY